MFRIQVNNNLNTIIFLFTHHTFELFLSTMFYFSFFYFLFNVRTNQSYANIENKKKRRWIEIKHAFNIIIDKNINSFNSNLDSLHNFNFFSNNFDLLHEVMFTRNRILQNVTFTFNNNLASKLNFKHRVTETKNRFLNIHNNTLISVFYANVNV